MDIHEDDEHEKKNDDEMLQHEFFEILIEDISVGMKYNTRAINSIEDSLVKYEKEVLKEGKRGSQLPPLHNTSSERGRKNRRMDDF